jgi:hypothetical protein
MLALFKPEWLRQFNAIWTGFGIALGKITAPILTGVVFVVAVIPTALLLRLLKRNLLNLQWDAKTASYWIERKPAGPDPKSMAQQF